MFQIFLIFTKIHELFSINCYSSFYIYFIFNDLFLNFNFNSLIMKINLSKRELNLFKFSKDC